jgi:hypothetical protein
MRDPDAVNAVPRAVDLNQWRSGNAYAHHLAVPGATVQTDGEHALADIVAGDFGMDLGHGTPRFEVRLSERCHIAIKYSIPNEV